MFGVGSVCGEVPDEKTKESSEVTLGHGHACTCLRLFRPTIDDTKRVQFVGAGIGLQPTSSRERGTGKSAVAAEVETDPLGI